MYDPNTTQFIICLPPAWLQTDTTHIITLYYDKGCDDTKINAQELSHNNRPS